MSTQRVDAIIISLKDTSGDLSILLVRTKINLSGNSISPQRSGLSEAPKLSDSSTAFMTTREEGRKLNAYLRQTKLSWSLKMSLELENESHLFGKSSCC